MSLPCEAVGKKEGHFLEETINELSCGNLLMNSIIIGIWKKKVALNYEWNVKAGCRAGNAPPLPGGRVQVQIL